MIRAILLDFYGVIQTDEVTIWAEKQVHEFPNLRQVIEEASTKIDLNKITLAQYYEELASAVGRSATEVKQELNDEIKINQPLLTIVDQLRTQGIKVGVLSNDGSSLRAYIDEHHIAQHFDVIFVSGELGVMKPDVRIYEYVVSKLELEPQEIIFFDDRQANVDGALRAGMQAELYTSVSQVRRLLS